jgi:hypothetical protein
LVADVYGLQTDKELVNTLEDSIQEQGAMDKLSSDCPKAETSECIKQILRALFISLCYCEPYHENQNFAENCYITTIKVTTNRVMTFPVLQQPLGYLLCVTCAYCLTTLQVPLLVENLLSKF